jgi:hypothetical protein
VYSDRTFALLVAALPVWSTGAALADVAVGSSYSVQLSASNAVSYALKAGSSLPAGLSMTTGGLVTGTVAAAATTTFTVTATGNAANATVDRTFTQLVAAVPVWTTGAALTDVLTGVAITTVNFAATNAVSYAVKSGSTLPAGIALSSAGALTGTPTVAGSYSFVVTATGASSVAVADRTFTWVVATPPVWTTAADLADATQGSAMTAVQLTATSAASYAVKSGSTLPAGVSLSSAGALTGTPTVAGSYSFVVTATGASPIATADRTFTQTVVSSGPTLTYVRHRSVQQRSSHRSLFLASDGKVYGCGYNGDGRLTGTVGSNIATCS